MLQMIYRETRLLKKMENNPRTIKDKDFKILCQSIKSNPEFFEARPLILSNRTGELIIIAGNQRFDAAEKNGLTSVPTVLLEGLTEEKEREIVIRDNVPNGAFNFTALADGWADMPLIEWGVPGLDFGQFTPNMAPQIGTAEVTDKDIEKKQKELDERAGRFMDSDKTIEVVCPECGNVYEVRL
jgi:hypothetical protein